MNKEKLKEHLKSMQYAFNESVEANKKEREKMNEQISIFKQYLKKGVIHEKNS
jgi:ribosomal protein S20